MPVLIPTNFRARVVWLGAQFRPVERLVIQSEAVAAMPLGFAGLEGEVHAGLTRPSCSRVTAQYPKGTEIRNVRQLTVVSAEEMAEVAAGMGLSRFDYAWVGASVVLEGIPDLTHLPPSSRLQGPDGVTIVVDMLNEPCQQVAATIAKAGHEEAKMFRSAAKGKRGVTAWVECEGSLHLGDEMVLHVPTQRTWAHLQAACQGS
ncbi:MAG TPA: sulfurase [Tabrizicola sp.]|nr:sulfurase [Tabrizicola sp.]